MSVWVYAASLLVSALSGERVACFVLCPPFRETVGANPLGTCRYDIEHFAAVLHW
jgi:hypothetical protein